MRFYLILSTALLSLHVTGVAACGYCVEDKIAAVYDFAIVTQALDRQHHVAFFAIAGNLAPSDGARRALEIVAESATGVDKGSVKVSIESATLALAFDPKRWALTDVQQALAQKLAAKKLALQPLRIIDQSRQMKVIDAKQ
ncbi:MAG: hypothetical protein HY081_12265 [Gammaproteobacteria bacterium]|nr:hypothetical protein [Gammaproteobacteria bacterium]